MNANALLTIPLGADMLIPGGDAVTLGRVTMSLATLTFGVYAWWKRVSLAVPQKEDEWDLPPVEAETILEYDTRQCFEALGAHLENF